MTVSAQDRMEQRAALAAVLLHHADILPRLEAGNVIHSVLLRGSGTVCWGEGARGVTEPLCFITCPFITMSPGCLRVSILSVLYQVWEESEFSGPLIRKWSQPAVIHGVVWMSYYTCWAPEAASEGWNVYSHSWELFLHRWDLFPLQCGGLSSLSRALTDLKRQNNINVWKAARTQFPFIFLSFTWNPHTVFRVSLRGGQTFVESQQHGLTADLAVNPFFFCFV